MKSRICGSAFKAAMVIARSIHRIKLEREARYRRRQGMYLATVYLETGPNEEKVK